MTPRLEPQRTLELQSSLRRHRSVNLLPIRRFVPKKSLPSRRR